MRHSFLFGLFLSTLSVGAVLVYVCNPARADRTSTFTQTILPRPQAVSVVDVRDIPIEQPTIDLSSTILSAILGTRDQRLRVMNPARDVDWSVTIAPSDGPSALWKSADASYDINDLSPVDGPDRDAQGGKLTIDPSQAQIHPIQELGDCPATDLSLGTASSFDEYAATVSSITLLSGSAVYTTYCGWDVTGIHVQQVVPQGQPEGAYTLDLMITII